MSRPRSTPHVYPLVAALLLALAPSGSAEKPHAEEPKAQHMEFDDDKVTGDVVRPDGDGVGSATHRKRPSLIKVRANFIAELVASTENL